MSWFLLAAALNIKCDYKIMSVDFASIAFTVWEDGRLDSSAQITMYGSTHKETLTPEEKPAPEDLIHAWISKENPKNTIELIIYKTRQPQGRSKIVNPQMPFGKEMWGECTGLPSA